MDLRKTSENVSRIFDAEGNAQERVENENFEILDSNGTAVGSANVGIGYAGVNINISGFESVADGEAKLKELLGITG